MFQPHEPAASLDEEVRELQRLKPAGNEGQNGRNERKYDHRIY